MNIPNLPIQILAVTDSGSANAFFNNDLSHLLITEGNATADRLHAHFMTTSSSCQQKSKFLYFIFEICLLLFLLLQRHFLRRFLKKFGIKNRKLSRRFIWRNLQVWMIVERVRWSIRDHNDMDILYHRLDTRVTI